MRYLFVVNSNITALCTKAVIAREAILHKDIIILTMRGARVKDDNYDLRHIDFIYPHVTNPIPQTRNIIKCWKVLKEFDQFIDTITEGQAFYCYVNHNMARNTELLVNHPRCKGFSILEEGTAAYNSQDYFKKTYVKKFPSVWDILGYKNRIRRRYFYRPDYHKVYAVTPKAFPGFRDKVLLKDVFSASSAKYRMYDNASIIVLDAVVAFQMIDMASFLTGMRKLISILSKGNEKVIYYKFHPAQPKDERSVITSLLSDYPEIQFVELADDVVLEEVVALANNLTIYLNISTISIYANAFGHRCFSFSGILSEINADYKSRIEGLNETLKESFIRLN